MSWEIKGTIGSLEFLPNIQYQSKVSAPKNPKLIREIKKIRQLKPSEFLKEMSMDTRQKLANTHEMYLPKIIELLDMGETSLQKNTQLVVDEPMFQPYPSEIYFQKFEPFNIYEVPLQLRNNDKVPRLVKVTQVDTPYFKIITDADAHQKVSPGLAVEYKIQFLPEENKDYNHELIITTEREKFVIPIFCIGSRAILDFPDEINFSLSPVKYLNSKVLLIRNIGNKDAKFSLKVDKPFSVSPEHGILPIGENMQVTIDFQPTKCGDYKKELMINYDSSETVYVNLYGATQDVNVRLDKNSIRIEDTFITMTNQRTVTISNRSDIIVHFEWKKYATVEEEKQQKLNEITHLNIEEKNVKNKLSNQNPDYIALLSRNFQNKVKTTQNKPLHFDDDVFFIQPIEGDIWPNSSTEINIIFKPDYAQIYNRTAFCEVTGRESRLPLRLSGIGTGPKVQLSIEVLDIGSIFIGSTHVYEVVMSNKGYIDAIFSVVMPSTTFGKFFSFEPNEGLISPGGFQAISIAICSNRLGDFDETFEFTIDGKPEKYKLIIKGSVIPPTFQFDIPKLKFGQVSYGFKYTHNCILANTSLVPMIFNLRVASDAESIITSDSKSNNNEKEEYNFKEFSITPSTGIIPAQSEIKLLVEFVPHFIKKYETSLIVDIEDVGNDLFSLPISARSTVPKINLLTTSIDLGRCFVFHSYERFIKLSNESSLKARYYLMPSKSTDQYKFHSHQAEGVIEPNSVKEVPVMADALQLGDLEDDLVIKINGSVDEPLRCRYKCLSQGPVVQIYPKDIDWGLTTVLYKSSREIVLSNESLIEAKFSTNMSKKNSVWYVEPSEGIVEPGSEISLQAICYLIDKVRYEDTINIEIEHSHTQRINVRAQGAGSSIVSEPPIGNMIDFGTYFSGGTVKRIFTLTNKSSKPQNLSFQADENYPKNMSKKQILKEREKLKHLPPPIFKVVPNRLELQPGDAKEISIEGFGEKPQLVEEILTCNSIIGKTSGKDRIMKFRLKCEFIAPLVSFSTKKIAFRCEHDGTSFPECQSKQLTLSNISSLDLNAQLNTNSPFYLVESETGDLLTQTTILMKTGDSIHINILFDTSFKTDTHNQVIESPLIISYAEHQHNDIVNLIGELYFPNIFLEKNEIDFGCILNNTEQVKYIQMTNISPLIVNYKWKFLLEKDNVVSNMIMETNLSEEEAKLEKIVEYNNIKENVNQNNDNIEEAVIENDLENTEQKNSNPNNEDVVVYQNEEMSSKDNENNDVKVEKPAVNPKTYKIKEILQRNNNEIDLPSIEEIFDISPLYGSLHPGESQKLKITYFGHKEIKSFVKAICEVKNGPEYELMLKGEASVLNYELSDRMIDLGYVIYDEISEAYINIKNLGKVAIEFSMIGADEDNTLIEPDKPVIIPSKGLVDADKIETITIKYLPGLPQKFTKKIQLQVSHFAPEEITIKGEAGFADIMLDLPRFENDAYKYLKKEAKNIVKMKEEMQQKTDSDIPIYQSLSIAPELDLQIEVDRLAIQDFITKKIATRNNSAISNYNNRTSALSKLKFMPSQKNNNVESIDDTKNGLVFSSNNNHMNLNIQTIPSNNLMINSPKLEKGVASPSNRTVDTYKNLTKKSDKPVLPDYILDFGHVILGTVKTHVIRAANMGKISASFEIERQNFSKTGFLIDLEKVKNLPNEESVEFVVTFDPRGANLGLGSVEHVIPLIILNGPIVNLRLKANVTMPDLQISNDIVEFSDVKCGECKIITVQLHNHKEVRCDWSAAYLPKKDERFTPMHLKRKKKSEGEPNKPRDFEIMPPTGSLMPGQKVNIQLKFMPSEEKSYEERVTIRMAQSSQRLMILCRGKGLEPRIELSKNSIEFEPILPHSQGDEQEIKIVNPCNFPIEIYNLEFDKNYLDEEKILRITKGYDEYNTILLPPRAPGDKLPLQLYEYYEEQLKKLDEEEKKQKQALNEELNQTESINTHRRHASAETEKTKSKSDEIQTQKTMAMTTAVGDVEKNPVFDSIAQYLGIDLSVEGRAARNRRGVAMIVHGPPVCGKSRAAVALAKFYECALLTIDSIVIDAISNSTSAAASKARQMCAETAAKYADEQRAQEALEQSKIAATAATTNASLNNQANAQQPGLSVEALAQHSISQGGPVVGSKKTSIAGDSHSNLKTRKAKIENLNVEQNSTHPSTPPPLLGPVARKLSISTNLFTQDDGYMSTVLPEDVIVEILSERFQLSDCNRGIVIDGLDTLFAQNHLFATTAILKAFNNRRYIYFFSIKSDFQKYKEQLNKIQEEKLKAKREKELEEQLFLEEMDEETYNNLPYEKRKEIDDRLLETKKLRLKKEAEEKAAEKERIEKELAEQQARLEEEKKKKKKTTASLKDDKKSVLGNQPSKSQQKNESADKNQKSSTLGHGGPPPPSTALNSERPHTREQPAPSNEEAEKKKNNKPISQSQQPVQQSGHEEEVVKEKIIDPEEEKRKEAEKLLQQKFKTYDLYYKDICILLDAWDRSQGNIFRQPSPSEKSDHEDHNKNNQKNKKDTKKTVKEKEKDKDKEKEKEKEAAEKLKAAQAQAAAAAAAEQQLKNEQQDGDITENETNETINQQSQIDERKNEDGIGVPHIIIENVNKSDLDEVYKHPRLPSISEVLDGMGLGPKGPPIPPPASFAVVPYPAYRKSPPGAEFSHYVFVTNNENDPNLISDEKPKEIAANLDTTGLEGEKTPEATNRKQPKTSTKKLDTGSRGDSRSDAAARRTSAVDSKKRTESRNRQTGVQSPNRGSSSMSGNKNDDNLDGSASIDGSSIEKPSQKLQRFRWILPQNSFVTIRLRFTSEEVGQFDQTLNFEIAGTRRRYQLHCRGICTFPTISREPRIVFPGRNKKREPNEIVKKKYIVSDDVYEFGPLLVGNNKERVKEGKFPEYEETLNIQNVSPLDSEVNFCFLEESADKVDSCFFLEPNELSLKPNETKQIKIYATPKESKLYVDSLVCCIKENPEPITFKISCLGQKPELTLDKKEFNFKQVLLHRKDSKDIKMTNNTMIPIQWRIEGVDTLGEEFVCNQTVGTIEPQTSFNLILHFRAIKPLVITPKDKKVLKLLVSSVNSFLGFMENHIITVTAEAYDVALEINLPKGNDGGLDFGNVRVNVENKLACTLRNKGKYPIKFNFLTEDYSQETAQVLKYLTITPASGELPSAYDRNSQNQTVQVIINTKKEINIKDAPILKCQITEPTATDNPIIANIPIKISVKAVLSRFNIIPQSEINFGPLHVGSKRQEKIIIENKGEFDFKFTLAKNIHESTKNASKEGAQNQGRLQLGIYTITPATGIILQGGYQIITIDCAPEVPGKFDEELVIDITDRNMNEYPHGIFYRLSCEAAYPSIANSIEMFEEHTIIPNLNALDPKMMVPGIYAEEENKFFFNNVIVGRTAKARFKLINSNKIPVDITLALKQSSKQSKVQLAETTFELEPQRTQIAPHSFAFATVTFTPAAMTSYSTVFEATLENTPNNIKNKALTFEICGDGNLPRFNILKPTLRNKKGQTLMIFKRCVVEHSDTQLLVLNNDGSLPSKVNFYLNDPDSAFKIKPTIKSNNGVVVKENEDTVSSVIIQPGENISFTVICTPRNIQTYQASLQMTVTDNQFEDTMIQMIGEGYLEDVIFENLHSLTNNGEIEDEVLADEDVTALKSNSISFGDVYVNDKKQLLFTMKNQSKTDCYRFEWPGISQMTGSNSSIQQTRESALINQSQSNSIDLAGQSQNGNQPVITFSPRIGHLHAGCAKDIKITFKSNETKFFRKELFSCNLTKISFDRPISEVKDWDDRITLIKWVNEVVLNAQPSGMTSSLNEHPISVAQKYSEMNNLPGAVNQSVNGPLMPAGPSKQIIRKKVVEIEPEPKYSKSDENTQPLELFVSANCDYSKYRCKTNVIRFKDTLMFQTRVFEVTVINRSKIAFDYNWKVVMEDSRRPFTPLIQPDSPTPENSPTPRGRGSKATKGGLAESSLSPSRKGRDGGNGKDASKDSKKETSKTPGLAKKGSSANLEDATKKEKNSQNSKLTKKEKDKINEVDEPTTTKGSKTDREINESKLFTAESTDILMGKINEESFLYPRPDSQALMRAESSLSHQAPSTITETGYVPFSVEPSFGKIDFGKTQTFKVKFSPLNVNDYQARLVCQIPNTEDGKIGPIIAVKGRGLLPYCHFELEESDYVTSGRRNPELPGPLGAASGLGLDPLTKVIEFNCIGLANKVIRKFDIINPTNVDYDFEWIKEEQNDIKKHDQFICLTPRGRILSGRKFEIIFEFEPSEIAIQETFWKFLIPKYDLSVSFLLVGHSTEPKVLFDKSHISFKPLLIGRIGRETINIINQENKQINFEFDQTSCYTEGRSAVILVDPSTGVLQPNSRTPIYLSYQPREQRKDTFNLKCKLSHSNKPINLNVKGEGFAMLTSLFCEDSNTGNKIEFSDSNINEIHMGQVEKNEVCFRNLYIANNGKYTANFEWVLTSQLEQALDCFTIEPQIGIVEPGDKKHSVLKYTAKLEQSTISNLILKVENGSTYHVHLDGIAVKPDLEFSFTNFDFGPCFVYRAGMKLRTVQLKMTNKGFKDLNISCLNEQLNSSFQFDFKQSILMPGKTTSTTITFIPRECKSYQEKLIFELNGLTRREIYLSGQGTQMRVELVDPKQKLFELGTIQIGKTIKKTLQIINRSLASVDFSLLFEPKNEILSKDKTVLQIQPSDSNISLKSNQILDLQFKFTSKCRISKFIEDLNIESNGITTPLCSIQGACHGYSIWLESNSLPFGAIAQKCSTSKRILLHNDGDIGASFKWDVEKFKPEFSIYPTMGYISPGMEVNCDITFSPTELSADIRKENIKCFIEGIQPLQLTLSGSCVQIIPQKEVHHFETFVRHKETKQITLSNRTNAAWELKPVIEGEYFSGLESFIVEAQSSNSYEIIYYPIVMTGSDGKKHTGSVFFSLPDGTGLLYNITGTANPPKPINKIQREVPCKIQYTEILMVENWLKKPQRFKVNFEITKPDKNDASTTIKGYDYIDVPGSGKKEYKLNYYAHKEGVTLLRVMFKNEQTNEYCYYDVGFKAVKGGTIGTIDLITQVRVPISYSLKLENPLANLISFNATCNNTEVLIPTNLSITAKGQGDFNFEFLPLKAGETTSRLELNSNDLGLCSYDLNLKALPAPTERPMHFKTWLGNSQTLTAKFINFYRQKTDYTTKIDNPDFKIDKSITAAPSQQPSGIEVSFEITYEPTNLNDSKCNLTFSSPAGGDYVIPLIGTCLQPKPQGPFIIKANSNTSISFKNVFLSPLTFTFAIDNPLFHVSKTTEHMKPHQTHKIIVGFDGNDSSNKADVMAKLVVTAPKSAGVTNNVQWVYYLKGTF